MDVNTAITSNNITKLIERFRETTPFLELNKRLKNIDHTEHTISGLAGASPAILLSSLIEYISEPIIAIAATNEEANDLYDDLRFLSGKSRIGHFPSLQSPPYEFRTPPAEHVGRRLSTLSRIMKNELDIVVAPIEAIIEPTMTYNNFEKQSLILSQGEEIEIHGLAEKLVNMGFRRVPLVEEVGDFAVRGGLIDFFSPGSEYPIRLEFFGDELDTIRRFEVSSQRTTEKLERVDLLPRREISVTLDSVENFIERLPESDGSLIRARYLNDPELPGLEWLATLFKIETGSIFDYFREKPLLFLGGVGNIEAETDLLFDSAATRLERIKEKLEAPPSIDDYYRNRKQTFNNFKNSCTIEAGAF